jgi:hypothetical protein
MAMTAPTLPRLRCLTDASELDPADVRAGHLIAATAAKAQWARVIPPRRRRERPIWTGRALKEPDLSVPPSVTLPDVVPVDDWSWNPLDGVPAPEYIPASWDGPQVGKRLIEAFGTLRRLPWSNGPKAFGNSWPAYEYEWSDLNSQEQADDDQKRRLAEARNRVRTRPSANDVTRMEAALGWAARYLTDIDREERRDGVHSLARVVGFVAMWRSAEREMEWIARKLRQHPATVRRRNRRGLDIIAAELVRDGVHVF